MTNKQSRLLYSLLGIIILLVIILGFGTAVSRVYADSSSTLFVTPLTWDVIGLDSNSPATGPRYFPVGAEVCNLTASPMINLPVNFIWQSANANINLRTGSLPSITIPTLAAGACYDAYFEVEINPAAISYDDTRRYLITANDGVDPASTPSPRQLYVEYLVSQARNSIDNIEFGPVGGPYTSVAPGGTMTLLVGGTYDIVLSGGTATGGYAQLESFITLPNTIFQVLDVETIYAVTAPPYVTNPNPALYGDACRWVNDPNSPNYRACTFSPGFNVGGNSVVTTYTVTIISGGGTTQSLNSLLYDFSGSSYHYNADYSVGVRFAAIVDPALVTITKAFTPDSIGVGGVSTLVFTINNPNAAALTGLNFTDTMPTQITVVSPVTTTTSGCGTPTFPLQAVAMS